MVMDQKGQSLEESLDLTISRSLIHVANDFRRLIWYTLFSRADNGWKLSLNDQPMTWRKGVKTPANGLSSLHLVKLSGWGLRDSKTR